MSSGSDSSCRVIVISGDPRVRRALRGLLMADGVARIVEEGETFPETSMDITRPCPDVVVIDLTAREADSQVVLIAKVRTECPRSAIIVIGPAPEGGADLFAAGGDGCIVAPESPWALRDVVEDAIRRRHEHDLRA